MSGGGCLVDCRARGVWGDRSHGWVSVEYKTLIAIEWRESQTYILHSYAPYLTACWRNLCVQRLTRKVVCKRAWRASVSVCGGSLR